MRYFLIILFTYLSVSAQWDRGGAGGAASTADTALYSVDAGTSGYAATAGTANVAISTADQDTVKANVYVGKDSPNKTQVGIGAYTVVQCSTIVPAQDSLAYNGGANNRWLRTYSRSYWFNQNLQMVPKNDSVVYWRYKGVRVDSAGKQ